MQKIQAVFFDLGWTLEQPATRDWFFTDCFRRYVSKEAQDACDESLWKQTLKEGFDYLERNHLMHDEQAEEEAMFFFYQHITSPFSEIRLTDEQCREIAHDHTYNYENCLLLPTALETLQTLKHQGYKIGIISDTWPSCTAQLKHENIFDYFDSITYSCDLGVYKPNPKMYQDALSKIQCPASACIFVDDLPQNLMGAQSFGIHPVLSIAKDPTQIPETPFPYVTKPEEVLTILEQYNR